MKRWITGWLVLALLGSACGGAPVPAPPAPAAAGSPVAGRPPVKLTIALGYIPDIQFAPFYVARENGYYRDEGLEVEFKQGYETDVLKLVGTGALQFGVVSGDEVLVARSQGVPVRTVATWYQKFPVSVIALEKTGITRVEDLRGRTVGVPGRFGATYVGLRALLASAGLRETDVRLQEVGFTQVQALIQGQVDAVVGYTNNEPVQLRALGQSITTLHVYERAPLVSNGVIADDKTAREQPELVRAVVRATLRGIEAVLADPQGAVDLTVAQYVPEAAGKRDLVRQLLDASLPLWQSDLTARNGLGYSDPDAWRISRDLLLSLKVLGGAVDPSQAFTNDFLPARRSP